MSLVLVPFGARARLASFPLRSHLLDSPAHFARGQVLFDGSDLWQMSEQAIDRRRWREISTVYQSSMNSLNPVLRILRQFEDTMIAHGWNDATEGDRTQRIVEVLENVDLEAARVMRAYPHELAGHQLQVGTRTGRRALDTWDQAVLFLRWLHDATRIAQLAVDNQIGRLTAYRYVNETLAVLADRAPAVHSAPTAASVAGYTHVNLDGTVIRTDRCSIAGPTRRVDLWWSGKHKAHGGNIQVLTAPDGWPIWVSPVRPGREHDTTCARAADGLLQAVQTWNTAGRHVLADLGYYEALDDQFVVPAKKPTGSQLTINERTRNTLHHRRMR